jgi:signal transduction histidine kinase
VRDYALAIRDKSGKVTDVLYNATVYRDETGEVQGVFAAARDITERKRMEAELAKSERLAAIGETAAMVGHDLRNPLQEIAAATYSLRTTLGAEIDGKARHMLDIIEDSVERSGKIISDLLDYSREMRLKSIDTNASSLVKQTLSHLKLPASIRVLDSTESQPTVRVDAGKMERAFANLIRNAVDPMPKGGTLTIASTKSTATCRWFSGTQEKE